MIKRVKVVPPEATNFHRDSTIRSSKKAKEPKKKTGHYQLVQIVQTPKSQESLCITM